MSYIYDRWDQILTEKIGLLPIPITDEDVWEYYPSYRWMFNKLSLCEVQNIEAAPHGIIPSKEVFSKPIYNLLGLSAGTKVIKEWSDEEYVPGHFCMELLKGTQTSFEVVYENGTPVWEAIMEPVIEKGSFSYWKTSHYRPNVKYFEKNYLSSYTGCFTYECIDNTIIEAVPRMSAQFIDLYGEGWLDSVVELYRSGHWTEVPRAEDAVSVILRCSKEYGDSVPYIKDLNLLIYLEQKVNNIYLPWYKNRKLNVISDDPYSYRLAVINSFSLEDAFEVRDQLVDIIKLP